MPPKLGGFMKFPDISELRESMSPEQREASDKMHFESYTKKFGESREILCTSEDDDGEKYLVKVDVEDFK